MAIWFSVHRNTCQQAIFTDLKTTKNIFSLLTRLAAAAAAAKSTEPAPFPGILIIVMLVLRADPATRGKALFGNADPFAVRFTPVEGVFMLVFMIPFTFECRLAFAEVIAGFEGDDVLEALFRSADPVLMLVVGGSGRGREVLEGVWESELYRFNGEADGFEGAVLGLVMGGLAALPVMNS